MALSFVEYTADGVDTQFTVTFAFISRGHVTVTIDGVDDATFVWINDGLIEPTDTPANLEKVRVTRTTPTGPLSQTDFVDGSTLVEADLDRVLQQAMYVAEESNDAADNALSIANDDATVWDAETQRIKNVLDAVGAQDAVSKSQLDAVVAAAGNVPTPADPGDDNKALIASSGTFSWVARGVAVILTFLGSANLAAARGNLELANTSLDNTVPRFDGVLGKQQTSGIVVDDDDNMSGHGGTINVQTDTTYLVVGTDNGKIITLDNASAITVTLPETSTETIPAGFQCVLIAKGAGQVTVAKEGSDTILSKDSNLKLTLQGSAATVFKMAAGSPNAYFLGGDLAA